MGRPPFEPGEQADSYWAICPYCGHKHEDPYEFADDNESEFQCYGCDQKFVVWAEREVTYRTMPLSRAAPERGGRNG